jgi:acyl transferase domain-containing protein
MNDAPIAVIGMGCRFPAAPDLRSFWENILADRCAIAPMTEARFARARYYDPAIGAYAKTYCALGGLIEDHPLAVRSLVLPPKTIASMDIAHLWALEVAEATFADAGIDRTAIEGTNTGVIVGHARGSMLTANMAFATAAEGMVDALDGTVRRETYQRAASRVHARYPQRTEDGGLGSMASGLSALISHAFRLTGRHMVVDAACASSFAALDLAVRATART